VEAALARAVDECCTPDLIDVNTNSLVIIVGLGLTRTEKGRAFRFRGVQACRWAICRVTANVDSAAINATSSSGFAGKMAKEEHEDLTLIVSSPNY